MTPLELAEKLTNVRGERFYFLTSLLQKLTTAELGLLDRTIDSYARGKAMPATVQSRRVLTYWFFPFENRTDAPGEGSYGLDLVRVDDQIQIGGVSHDLMFVLLNPKGERIGRFVNSPYHYQLEDAALAYHADLRYRVVATDANGEVIARQSFLRDNFGRGEAGQFAVTLKEDERVSKIVIFSGDADGPDRSYYSRLEKHIKEDGEIEWRSSSSHGPEPRKVDYRLTPQPLEHVE